MKPLPLVSLLFTCIITPSIGVGQTFPTFDEVDYVTVQDFGVFQDIWDKAETQNVRIALFGDSQETSPGGHGAVFIPALNYEFYQHFGKVGESFVAPGIGSYGGGTPAAEWLLQGTPGRYAGTSTGTLSSSQLLPGTTSWIFTSAALGQNTLLNTENTNLNDNSFLTSADPLWDSTNEVTATIFGVTREGSDEFSWATSPTNGNSSFFLPKLLTGTTSMGLDAPAGQILSQDTEVLPFNGMTRQQLIVKGTGENGAELLGVRFNNLSVPGGVSIQDFAVGGYRTNFFLENHADAGPMLSAFGPWDAILIHTAANDAYAALGDSAIVYQSNVLDFIEAVRSPDWLDNPDQKFILVTDPYRHEGPEDKNFQFDQYAGAIAELALNDPNVMAVNSRRLTQELGWVGDNSSLYLRDVVHYSSEGAKLLARVEAQLILNGGLIGDFDNDNDVDLDDIDFYVGNLGSPAQFGFAQLDLNSDAQITLDDFELHVTTFVRTNNGQTGTFIGDLNLNGTVDVLGDALTLIGNLGNPATSYGQGDLNLDGTVDVLDDAFTLIAMLGSTNEP
ncbi:hypothetical protein N9L06_07155 [Mariniblastus sp.]|nr:hypothetical protein [Mariniblastus sp.]